MPGLLQTMDYAGAFLRTWGLRADAIGSRVVPTSTSAHLGQLGGFIRLGFLATAGVVVVELANSSVLLDEPLLTDAYQQALTRRRSLIRQHAQSVSRQAGGVGAPRSAVGSSL